MSQLIIEDKEQVFVNSLDGLDQTQLSENRTKL